MRTLTAVFCLLLGMLLHLGVASGDILLVPDQYDTIQDAVDAAVYGDEILVAAGTYSDPTHPAGAGDTTRCCVILKSGITLTGAGMGETIIDADSSARAIYLYQADDVKIRHLTVTGGFAEVYGAGIYCKQSSPDIRYVEAVENYDGGITMTSGSNPTIVFCTTHDNEAKAGGGLDVGLGCEPYVYRCSIYNNDAPFAAGVRLRGSGILEGCTINGNQTTGAVNVLGGGVLVIDTAAPTIIHCEIRDNTCYGDGGGICFMGEGTGGLLEDCEITGNAGTGMETRGGGIAIGSQANVQIVDCLIADNYTTGEWSDGGGLWAQYSSLAMENCTFYGNWTEGNPEYGAGNAGNAGFETSIYIPGTIDVTHCIFAGSPDGKGVYCTNEEEPPSIGCCDVHGNEGGDDICGIGGQDNFSQDPEFCDIGAGNFHVLPDSPCAPYHHPGGFGTCDNLLIGAFTAGCESEVEYPVSEIGGSVALLGNQPNPFTRSTIISFQLPGSEQVSLDVFDPSGRRIAILKRGTLPAGIHNVAWDGLTSTRERAASGIYFYQLTIGERVWGRRMLRLR
ncbi:MAG: right-handed parallel beta-helix repeat-containing protein [Candidatus Eisenbacteria sp.]|nr:right-handed parallel beta-helix repeat-containing protein [Candidatus Eisenbacteria bacterium]